MPCPPSPAPFKERAWSTAIQAFVLTPPRNVGMLIDLLIKLDLSMLAEGVEDSSYSPLG